MADSFLGDIGSIAGGSLSGMLKDLPPDMFKAVNEQITESMGSLMHSLGDSGNLNEAMSSLLQSAPADVVEATPDTHSDAFTSTAPNIELTPASLDDFASKIDALSEAAMARMSSPDKATAEQGQAEMQQIQQVFDSVLKIVQEQGDAAKDAIEGLHSDAGTSDATVVAVADTGDAHNLVHADTDAGYDHPADHGADNAADHATAAPQHVDTTPADADGVA